MNTTLAKWVRGVSIAVAAAACVGGGVMFLYGCINDPAGMFWAVLGVVLMFSALTLISCVAIFVAEAWDQKPR